jgi:hypothetical protein
MVERGFARPHQPKDEPKKKGGMLYLIKSLCKASMVIEVGFFLLILKLLYFSITL